MGPYLIVIVILLMFSAFFSATETSFTSFSRIKMKNMANDDVRHADLVLKLADQYDKLLSTILIGNNIANIATSSVATVLFISLYGNAAGPTIATIVITIVVLIFGEITPKNIAKDYPERYALFAAPIIRVIVMIFTPVNFIFSLWKALVDKIFSAERDEGFSEDELKTMVEEANIGEEQSELITNAIEFEELEAIDVVTPRIDIIALEVGTSNEEAAKIFKETGLSRLPIYKDDLDSIIGVLNQKDFHNYVVGESKPMADYVKPVVFVAETIKASVLLKKMQANKTHIAIVVDEYGGTTGLVTMEDIIEELVGKIYDEHDAIETRDITELYDGSYNVAGGANLDKFFELFDEDIDADATTINGWVMIELDRLPKVSDSFVYESRHKIFRVHVTKADSRRALMTHIRVEDREIEEDDEEEMRNARSKR